MKFIHDMAAMDQAFPETGYWWLGLTYLGEYNKNNYVA
jgi:hypothetical protein